MDLVEWSLAIEVRLQRPPLIRFNGKRAIDTEWTTGPWEHPDEWRSRLDGWTGNVAMLTGRGLAAVDADTYKPGGQGSFDALVANADLDLDTLTQITGSGGRHYLYTYDPGLHVPSITLEPYGYPCVDLKGDDGCIIFEPSVGADGGRYLLEEPGIDEVAVPFSKEFLNLVGAAKTRGRPRRSGRWRPLEESDDVDERDLEVVKLLVEHFGGHDPVLLRDGSIGIWRPGKSIENASAVTGLVGPGVTTFWTTHWAPFELGKTYGLGALRSLAGLGHRYDIPAAGPELPDGYRLWHEGDDVVPAPTLGPDVYHGMIGDFLRLVEGETEGHPAAIGAHLLACIGTLLGREVAYRAGTEIHFPKLHIAIVGPTSAGVKGVSENVAMLLVDKIKPDFFEQHSMTGVGSGEVVITEMRDGADPPTEKRRIVLDAELSSVLRVVRREGSILGDVVRKTFDNRPLRNSTKKGGVEVATDHHLSIVGSTTPGELRALTEEIAILNGFSNRFFYAWSELSMFLPVGGHIDDQAVRRLSENFTAVQTWIRQRPSVNGTSRWYDIVEGSPVFDLWDPFFVDRRQGVGDSEMMRAITGRQVPHAIRIALIYAALDRSDRLELEHVAAGIAWCDYAVGSINRIFTTGPGSRTGQLLEAIRAAGAAGLDGSAQHQVFGRNLPADAMAALRKTLEDRRLIHTATTPTDGRPRLTSYAIADGTNVRKRRNKGAGS